MASRFLSIIIVVVSVAISAVARDCVPEQDNFYWKTPCDGQTFDNLIKVTSVKVSQNGHDVDDAGGLDLTTDIDVQVDFENDYGPIQKPLFDASFWVYSRLLFGKCRWIAIPTLGFTTNLDPCAITPECHVDNNETTVAITFNPQETVGPLLAFITVGDYYSAAVTYKDDQTPVACVYGQDKVIKK